MINWSGDSGAVVVQLAQTLDSAVGVFPQQIDVAGLSRWALRL